MGIHGNATAQIVLDGAVGTLVGEPNKGLQAMFVMMNAARLGVGMQSLGLTEVAYQNALAYAKDRMQMRIAVRPEGARTSRPTRSSCTPTCADAADRARPTPKAAARSRSYCALLIDRELHHPDEEVRKDCGRRWSRC